MKSITLLFAAALVFAGAALAQVPTARSDQEAAASPPPPALPVYSNPPAYANPPVYAHPPTQGAAACPTCGALRQAPAYAAPSAYPPREVVRVVYVEPVTWAPAYYGGYCAPRPPLDPFTEIRVNPIPWPPQYCAPRFALAPLFGRCR